jgi:endonuclease/exonuclease/phosphatase family metal-dependent hydrolase
MSDAASAVGARLSVATYNLHRCVGGDGRMDPARVARVLRQLDCDVLSLQEVDCATHGPGGVDQGALLAREVGGLHVVAAPLVRRGSVSTGNAILSRHAVKAVRQVDLSVHSREPRMALDVDLDVHGQRVRVVGTHFGLRGVERMAQVDRLLAALAEGDEALTVLLGDFNEWRARGHSLRSLAAAFPDEASGLTFPALWPVLPLDRVFLRRQGRISQSGPHATPEARRASDHLPFRALIDLP